MTIKISGGGGPKRLGFGDAGGGVVRFPKSPLKRLKRPGRAEAPRREMEAAEIEFAEHYEDPAFNKIRGLAERIKRGEP